MRSRADIDGTIQARLIEMTQKLARAIASGEVTPAPGEMEALAIVLDEHHLPIEANRVRRWMAVAR